MRLRDPEPGLAVDADRDPVRLVHAALDRGVTLLDTAQMYGNEELVGRGIKGRRDEVLLCTKFGVVWGASGRFDDWSVQADAATVVRSCEESLRRLGVDVIDLYYLHHRSEDTPIEETVSAMATLVDEGKIRAIGLSNVTIEDVRRAHGVHPVAALQEQWSLAATTAEQFLSTLAELGIALVAHSPLSHGQLTNRDASTEVRSALAKPAARLGSTPEQVALAWVCHRQRKYPQPIIPLPGATSIAHLEANIAAASFVLTESEMEQLDAVSASGR